MNTSHKTNYPFRPGCRPQNRLKARLYSVHSQFYRLCIYDLRVFRVTCIPKSSETKKTTVCA